MSISVADDASSVNEGPPQVKRKSSSGGILLGFTELWQGREILKNIVRRDLTVRHRGSFFGMLWSLATPLLTVGLYTFIFTVILTTSPAKDSGDVPFAVYFFVGLTLWNLFSSSLIAASGSIVGGGYLLKKVYFRREILPLSAVMSAAVTFCFEFSVAVAAIVVFVGVPGWEIIFAPLILAVVLLLCYGAGLLLATATVFFRDIEHFIGILVQVWFWGTPIIYTLSLVSNRPGFVRLLKLNPMTGPVVSFRDTLLLHRQPEWDLLAYDLLVAIVLVAAGQYVFRRSQRLFAEMI